MRIVFSGVSTSYNSDSSNPSWALCDINLTIEQGEFLGIAGSTGSGKSTLLQHVNGLLRPTKGSVEVDGKSLSEKGQANTLRGRIGLVMQYPERQMFATTVLEDVCFGPLNMGLSKEQAQECARLALETMGLDADEIGMRNPFTLSGGMQRRIALAGVLAMKPEVLVLDEPAVGLDPASHDELMGTILDLNVQGTTIIMASHNMDDLAFCCDRILVLNEGSQVMLGEPAEVFFQQDALEVAGLELPFAMRCARRLADAGIVHPRRFYREIADLANDLVRILP